MDVLVGPHMKNPLPPYVLSIVNLSVKFTIAERLTILIVNLSAKFTIVSLPPYWVLSTSWLLIYLITMWIPWVWLGRIGEYRLRPSKLGNNTNLRPSAVGPYWTPISQDSDGIPRYVLARLTVIYHFSWQSSVLKLCNLKNFKIKHRHTYMDLIMFVSIS